jgi:hypothetical protein
MGYVYGMEGQRDPKKALEGKPGARKRGKPQKR